MPPVMPRPWFSPSRNAAEASWTPCWLTACSRELAAPGRANNVTWPASACRRRPIIRGTSGPYRSASTRPTRGPCAVRARARFTATVVFPTPPFPLAIAMTGTCSGLSGIPCIFPAPALGDPGDPLRKAEDLFKKWFRGFLLALGALYRHIHCAVVYPAPSCPDGRRRVRAVLDRSRIRCRDGDLVGRWYPVFSRQIGLSSGLRVRRVGWVGPAAVRAGPYRGGAGRDHAGPAGPDQEAGRRGGGAARRRRKGHGQRAWRRRAGRLPAGVPALDPA